MRDAELRIATALVATYEELLTAGVSPTGHAYLWRYTWRHCADAGTPGIAALRRLAGLDRAAFLPDLVLASRYLANRQVEARKPFEAVGPAEDAVTAYREVGRRADAVAPAEEAVTVYREQAAANPAYLPDLATALNNLGKYRQDAGLS